MMRHDAAVSAGSEATVGFVGLGSIGRPMAEALLRAGVPTVVHDLDHEAVARLVAAGAESADTLADLASRASVVGVCVPADPHVRAVLDGPDGLLAHLPEGSTVGIHSTVLPETVLWAAREAEGRGISVVEAPVTGGPLAAAEGRSTFLLGGDQDAIGALAPILDACGKVQVRAGELGDASRLKLCLNLQTYSTFMGVAEAATLAKRLGLDLSALKDVMRANGQLGELVDWYLILHEPGAVDPSDPDTRAQLEGYAAIINKDLDLIRRLAADAGVPVPAAELAGSLAERVYFVEHEANGRLG